MTCNHCKQRSAVVAMVIGCLCVQCRDGIVSVGKLPRRGKPRPERNLPKKGIATLWEYWA